MAITVTDAAESDVAELATFGQSLEAIPARVHRCLPTSTVPADEDTVRQLLATFTVLLARENGGLVAYAATKADGTIKWLVADPDAARFRRGVARLLRAVAERCGRATGQVHSPQVRAALVAAGCTANGQYVTWVG